MNTESRLRKNILRKVKEFYLIKHKKRKFIPNTSQINYAGRVYNEKEIVNLIDASLDFWLTAGKYAKLFENKLSAFLKVKYCNLTNSGSSANLLAISALTSHLLKKRRLTPKDEVITTACGFPTTLNPILQNNLTPVFVDLELGSYTVNPKVLENAITKNTKAIFIGHILGNPSNMDSIYKVIKKHNLWFIEDNCDSLGSLYNGKTTGSFGHISTCSFYPAHHITTGEGGAVLTNNPTLEKAILSFRDWGRDCWCEPGVDNTCKKRFMQKFDNLPLGYDHKYVYSHIGYNLKITDIQAAIGVAQLDKLPGFIRMRRRNFNYLYDRLKKYEEYFILPAAGKNANPSWFGFALMVKDNAPFTRNDIVEYLEKNRISTRMLFGGNLIKQPAYKNIKFRISGGLKNTDKIMNDLFWIGVYPGIDKEKLEYIGNTFDIFFKKWRKS